MYLFKSNFLSFLDTFSENISTDGPPNNPFWTPQGSWSKCKGQWPC